MEFSDAIKSLSERIERLLESVETEEATKTSFILPMINILGYDIFDPTVVVPEFTADIGKKKNEKVDYAILHDGKPLILIEAKPHTEKLDRHKTQLERYFTVTDCKFAILTNGIEYRFYSDLVKPNVMDQAPFLIVDMLDMKPREVKQLEKFAKDAIDIDNIINMAGEKKYVTGIKDIFTQETINPSDEMARFFASRLTDKVLRQNVLDEFKRHIKQAFSEIVNDMVNNKITSIKNKLAEENRVESGTSIEENIEENAIETTQEELEGFFIVKSILAEAVALNRIVARDTKSYFGILLDDNNRKWICRLHFNSNTTKYIGIHTTDKQEERFDIQRLEDIYKYKKELLSTIERLMS